MKRPATYPKTYATLVEIITAGQFNRWTMPEGPLPIYVFVTDDDEVIQANNPELRGRVPDRARVSGYIGERVKLFKRTPTANRWSYKFSGT